MARIEMPRGPYSAEELDELGVKHGPPPESACEFCGREIAQSALVFGDSVVWVRGEECDCEGVREKRRLQEEAEARQRQRELEERYLKAGVEERYLGARIVHAPVAEAMAGLYDGSGSGIYLHGIGGSGKTMHASAVAKLLVESGQRVHMVPTVELLSGIQAAFDGRGDATAVVERCKSCDVLILDDIGKEKASQWAGSKLFEVINKRYNALLPVVYTSELDYGELLAWLSRHGDRKTAQSIVNRIREVSELIRMPDVDYRAVARRHAPSVRFP